MNVQEFKKAVQKIVDEAHTLLKAFGSDKGLRAYTAPNMIQGCIYFAPKEAHVEGNLPPTTGRFVMVGTDRANGNLVMSFCEHQEVGVQPAHVEATFGYLDHEHDMAANQMSQWMQARVVPTIVHVAKKPRK